MIVVGDVAGHGLQAAMLVSLLVGAIRNQADTSFDPLSLLQSLNRRLLGRGHANATCLALCMAPDGSATLANAGHLPPYVNGKEMSMEGALPLGTAEDTEFAVMHFQLEPGDRLTFVSDGVVEATNEERELFGFARTQEISNQPAATIAAMAQKFGQEDDITVVSVVRTAQVMAAV
ncbi:MAG TPA: PP2C family protein-serine/threonine phosphatase [Acidobacteriaceae bacterium]|nr:PP2C family protein-serine/threonine phosphatase [Acidobacteriaceae bacterium]